LPPSLMRQRGFARSRALQSVNCRQRTLATAKNREVAPAADEALAGLLKSDAATVLPHGFDPDTPPRLPLAIWHAASHRVIFLKTPALSRC
jgi:hypothetical protein